MNGVHDMGGMHGFGPVDTSAIESFHEDWERRLLGIDKLLQYQSVYGLDEKRAEIERIQPTRYLSSGYYERWLLAILRLLEEDGLLTEEELQGYLDSGTPCADGETEGIDHTAETDHDETVDHTAETDHDETTDPNVAHDDGLTAVARVGFESPASYDRSGGPPAFEIGDPVAVRNSHPAHHTRCPRYVRRAHGEIASIHGTHVFPDAAARGVERAVPLYSVRFDATELWGEVDTARSDTIYVDLWEPYLASPGR